MCSCALLCFTVLNFSARDASQETNSYVEHVLRKALRLLELMLSGFVDAQRLVFDRLDELLAVQVALDQMALALKQVF